MSEVGLYYYYLQAAECKIALDCIHNSEHFQSYLTMIGYLNTTIYKVYINLNNRLVQVVL